MVKLGNYTEMNFEPVPVDDYQVQIVDAKKGITQNGKAYMQTNSVIVSGEYKGKHLFHTVWLSLKALPFSLSFLYALGYDANDELPDDGVNLTIDETYFINKQLAVCVIGHEEYEDKNGEKKKKEILGKFLSLQDANKQTINYEADDGVPF